MTIRRAVLVIVAALMCGSLHTQTSNGQIKGTILHAITVRVHQQHTCAYWSYTTSYRNGHAAWRTRSRPYRKWIRHLWYTRAHQTCAVYHQMGSLTSDWSCIHSYEGSWTDPNAPYWGGLQMDTTFMMSYNPRAYARYGTADHWPVAEQVIAAKRAYASRGYTPWPNTARYCGLL